MGIFGEVAKRHYTNGAMGKFENLKMRQFED
jgi:hypothetical protein